VNFMNTLGFPFGLLTIRRICYEVRMKRKKPGKTSRL